jgi:hypothetical protein
LTGKESGDVESNGEVVLVVNGAGTNAMSYFVPDYLYPVGTTAEEKRKHESEIAQLIKDKDESVYGILTSLKEKLTEGEWTKFASLLSIKDVDVDSTLAEASPPKYDEQEQYCADLEVEDRVQRYLTSLADDTTT